MMNLQILHNPSIIHLATIIISFLITFFRILGKDFFVVIDDIEGIKRFDEVWKQEKDKDGKITKEEKIDSYEVVPGKKVKFLSFIPELGFPGNILRFLRLHIGKEFCVIGTNAKGHEVYGYRQSPRRHHILSMVVQIANLILGYAFLKNFIPEQLAFGAMLLFAVNPLTTQVVAWISGINYSLSLLFSLALLNTACYYHFPELKYIVIALLSFLSTITLYLGGLTGTILLFLGLKWEALAALIVGISIIVWKGLETKNYRISAFKEQNMEKSTKISARKIVVMFKTLWYYMRLVWLPIYMGLYHVWGYHYDEKIERIDRMFWFGILTLIGFITGFYFGDTSIRLGIIWFFSFYIIFSNLMTAQQFIADRYVTIASMGTCIILARLLYGTPFFWVLVGLYAMRTFLHLPTFKNEIDFYQSNFLNFRKSEVSLGNLGVAYINQGMPGAAVDTWMLATRINPLYDVPWYNLFSVFKGNGRLPEAREFLKRCLDAKVVHFESRWKEELVELDKVIAAQNSPNKSGVELYNKAAEHYVAKDLAKEIECLRAFMKCSTDGIIPEMIEQVKTRLAQLESTDQLHHTVCEPAGPKITGSNPVNQGSGLPTK